MSPSAFGFCIRHSNIAANTRGCSSSDKHTPHVCIREIREKPKCNPCFSPPATSSASNDLLFLITAAHITCIRMPYCIAYCTKLCGSSLNWTLALPIPSSPDPTELIHPSASIRIRQTKTIAYHTNDTFHLFSDEVFVVVVDCWLFNVHSPLFTLFHHLPESQALIFVRFVSFFFLCYLQCIYGCYVHSAILPTFHRRCYWLLQVICYEYTRFLPRAVASHICVKSNQKIHTEHEQRIEWREWNMILSTYLFHSVCLLCS